MHPPSPNPCNPLPRFFQCCSECESFTASISLKDLYVYVCVCVCVCVCGGPSRRSCIDAGLVTRYIPHHPPLPPLPLPPQPPLQSPQLPFLPRPPIRPHCRNLLNMPFHHLKDKQERKQTQLSTVAILCIVITSVQCVFPSTLMDSFLYRWEMPKSI